MEVLWTRGACSVREIHEDLPEEGRPAFTTLGTMVYRLEKKQALRCVKRISNANIFDAVISRDEAHTRLIDDEEFAGSFRRLELQPELLLYRREDRRSRGLAQGAPPLDELQA